MYDVVVQDIPSEGFIYEGPRELFPRVTWVKVNPSNFKLVWRIVDVRSEWAVVELSIVFPRAVNLNTSETLDYRMTKIFEVNIRTLQAYTDFEGRRFWALEWPFLLRPEQVVNNSVKLLFKPLEGPVVIISPDYEWYKEGIEPVLREINETIVLLTNGSRNINSYVSVKVETEGGYKYATVYLNRIPPGWSKYTEGKFLGLTLKFVAIDMPPAPRDYSYAGIQLDRSRLALATSKLKLTELNDRVLRNKNIYLSVPEIAGIYNITIKHPGDVRGEHTYSHVLIVDRWGNLYVANPSEPDVQEALYDVVSGVLVYAKIGAKVSSAVHAFLKYFYLLVDENVTLNVGFSGFRDTVVEVRLAYTNIPLERPIIGGRPPTQSPPLVGVTSGEESRTTSTTTPRWERTVTQEVTPKGVSVNWFLVVTAIILTSLLALLVLYARFRGR